MSLSREELRIDCTNAARFAFANLESRNSWRIILEIPITFARNVCDLSERLNRKFKINTLEVSALKLRGAFSVDFSQLFLAGARRGSREFSSAGERQQVCRLC